MSAGHAVELSGRTLNPRQADTVEKLLVAGLEELRAVGHETLTVRTVAQRAGVSPATAYTYLASKNHLFSQLFWQHLTVEEPVQFTPGAPAAVRVREAIGALVARIMIEPELAAAVTPALLGTDPDVARFRLLIGAEFVGRFEAALADPDHPGDAPDPALIDVLLMTFSGALLQAGMGLATYDALAERLAGAVDVIMRGTDRP